MITSKISRTNLIVLIIITLFLYPSQIFTKEIKVLVISIDGLNKGQKEWQPTIGYLQDHLDGYEFKLITVLPGDIENIRKLVSSGDVDFVISQPAIYVDLEQRYGISKILTLENDDRLAEFGSVIITRPGSGIYGINDLNGKIIGGVSKLAFGGWLVGYNEMLESGFDPYKSAARVEFLGTQSNVMEAVINGKIDAGVLRTGMLEKYFKSGKIKPVDIHVINKKTHPHFGYLSSTALYPEWAFSRTRNVGNFLAEKVGLAALSIPTGGDVARQGRYWGWTLPYDYKPVHDLMKKLKVGPYEDYGKVTLAMLYSQYRPAILLSGVFTIIFLMMGAVILRYNHILLQKDREKELAHRKVIHMANHDELTNIPNRRLFYETLSRELKESRADKGNTAILFLDLDGFKEINDVFGHALGDRVLQDTAAAITSCIRHGDFAARIGGDEFICFLSGVNTMKEASRIAEKVIAAIADISLPEGYEIDKFGASGGLVLAGPKYTDPDELVRQADDLMYSAKELGKGRYLSSDLTDATTSPQIHQSRPPR